MVLDVQPEQQQIQVVGAGVGAAGTRSLTSTLSCIAGSAAAAAPSSSSVELEEPCPLPFGWQKFLNLQSGEIYYKKDHKQTSVRRDPNNMSRNRMSPKLDLKLNLSPPRVNLQVEPNRSMVSSTPTSPASSCLSSELNNDDTLRYSNSPEATSMVLVGCPRCLMYVMLSEDDPKCPKCKSTVLLDFLHENTNKKSRTN